MCCLKRKGEEQSCPCLLSNGMLRNSVKQNLLIHLCQNGNNDKSTVKNKMSICRGEMEGSVLQTPLEAFEIPSLNSIAQCQTSLIC